MTSGATVEGGTFVLKNSYYLMTSDVAFGRVGTPGIGMHYCAKMIEQRQFQFQLDAVNQDFETDLYKVQLILCKKKQDVEDEDETTDARQMSGGMTAFMTASSGNTHEMVYHLIEVDAAYDPFLYTKADQLDSIIDCSRSSRVCVSAKVTEEEDSHWDM